MLLVAFITIVAFVFLYNTTQLDELASVRDPSIYGKPLNPAAIERQVKNYHLTTALGQFDLLEKLGGTLPDQGMAITQFVWNLLVLQHQSQELGVEHKTLANDARAALEAYQWPGNVRELVNLCRRLSVLAPGSEIRLDDLPTEILGASLAQDAQGWSALLARWAETEALQSGASPLLDTALPEFERTLIRVALKHTQGHRQDAARLLGWGRNTLTRKLKELGMEEAELDQDGEAAA